MHLPSYSRVLRAIGVAVLLAAIGCAGDPPAPAPAVPAAPVIETISLDTLPKVSDALPAQGSPAVEVGKPDRWTPIRRRESLFYFRRRQESEYPAIYITQAAWTGDAAVTEANVGKFAEALKAQLTGPRIKDVTPIRIGKFVGVYYLDKFSDGTTPMERLVMATVQQGSKFTLELSAREGTLLDLVPAAHAVAASMNFNPASPPKIGEPDADPSDDSKPDEPKPGEEKPSDEKPGEVRPGGQGAAAAGAQ